MRIVVNQLTSLGPKTGVGHYAAELLRGLRDNDDSDDIVTFPGKWMGRAWQTASGLCRTKQARVHATRGASASGLKHRLLGCLREGGRATLASCFQAVCNAQRFDLYHEPNFIPLPADVPTVATVHDLSMLVNPSWHPADRTAYFEKHLPRALAQCQQIIAVSEFTRREIIRLLDVPPRCVTRVYNGIRSSLGRLPAAAVSARLHALGLPESYLLHVGTIEPRKNLRLLLEAYCTLPGELRSRCLLVLAGKIGWNAGDVLEYLHNQARQHGVIHLGYVSEADLAVLYNGARALVYPSHYEGFGLPPVEMLACGGAVLASSAEALQETVGTQAHFIHPEDIDGWRASMARVVIDDDWLMTLRQGAQASVRHFTWEQCAADTRAIYREACGWPAHSTEQRRAA